MRTITIEEHVADLMGSTRSTKFDTVAGQEENHAGEHDRIGYRKRTSSRSTEWMRRAA